MSLIPANLHLLEIPGIATFESGPGGLTRLVVRSPLAEAHIYLHGAHVSHFQPVGSTPVLFMSEKSLFAPDKPIRGGVPLIFPWFGGRSGYPESPAHGFARVTDWQIDSVAIDDDQVVTVAFTMTASDLTRAAWPHEFALEYRVSVGSTLSLTLEVANTGNEPFSFENALHSYFVVGDVRDTSTAGLVGAENVDKTDAMSRKKQGQEPIRITQETDRVFENSRTKCVLDDPKLKRRITVEKAGSQTTVVWNPWVAKSAAMADFGDNEWPQMLCIETANAGTDAIALPAGERHTMRAVISVA